MVVCCGRNEGLNKCFNLCHARTCENRIPNNRVCVQSCRENSCDCAEGFRRNNCGECVSDELCNKPCDPLRPIACRGKNEKLIPCFDLMKARVCSNARPSQQPSCPTDSPFSLDLDDKFDWTDDPHKSENMCILNICDCMEGFFRNKCGICVKKRDCKKPCRLERCDTCSDPNEMRYKRLRECEARSCANRKNLVQCKGTDRVYRNQCDCKQHYYRDRCGRCVSEKECDNQRPCQCTNPCEMVKHEAWRCVNTCTESTCSNVFNPKMCFAEFCSFKCDCMDNFWRNMAGKCVPKRECTPQDTEVTSQWIKNTDVRPQ